MTIGGSQIARALIVAALLAAAVGAAAAHAVKAGGLVLNHPSIRATPPGAATAAGTVVIENRSDTADRLVAATAEVAGTVEIHRTTMEGDVMRMRPVAGGVEIPARGRLALKSGGYHVMFMQLRRPLAEGDRVAGTLVFEQAGPVSFQWEVGPMAAPAHGGAHAP